jgi:thiazolinyl imide reductase
MQVLLCGTQYGSSYLSALWQHPSGLRLGGVLSRGSERSRQLARQASVPYYSGLTRLPPDAVDAACVAVSGTAGVELAVGLLERGVHVLAEHPMEPEDVERCLEAAARNERVFHLNSHFGDLETVAPFVDGCVNARRQTPLFFLSLTVNPRTLYSALDILGRVLGTLEPFEVLPAASSTQSVPEVFATVSAVVGGVPLTVLCQRVASPADDGSATLVGHQVTAGFGAGQMTLGDAFGPVTWLTRIAPGAPPGQPWWTRFGPEATAVQDGGVRERANRLALERFAEQVDGGAVPPMQAPEHLLGVSRAWRAILDAAGATAVGSYPWSYTSTAA